MKKSVKKKKSAGIKSKKKVVKKKTALKKNVKKKTTSKKKIAKKKTTSKKKIAKKKATPKKKVAKKKTASQKKAAQKKTASKKKAAQKKTAPKKKAAKKKTASKKKAAKKKTTPQKKAARKKVTPKTKAVNKKAAPTIKKKTTATEQPKPSKQSRAKTYMTNKQLKYFYSVLIARKKALMEEAGRMVDHMKSDSNQYADSADRATQEEEFTLELRERDRERKLMQKIDEALMKISNKEYGYCVSCGIEIGISRLEARPTTDQCIDCKMLDEIVERHSPAS